MSAPSNPIATEEQHAHERAALELIEHPIVREAARGVHARWLDAVDPSEEMRARYDAAFEEVMFSAAIWSSNGDPERPRVVTISRLEHELDGTRIPGSRWGIDNPDSVYRVIPISGAERYVLRGRVFEPRLTENYFTLWDDQRNTVDVLDGSALALGPDGSFEIEVDAAPAGGRPNHVRSSPAAREFYVRDVVQDWSRETPNVLSAERLGEPPRQVAPDAGARARRAAGFMQRFAEDTVRWNAQCRDEPANSLDFTIDRDTDGALRNQVYVLGRFDLEDDQALVLRVHTGGARYFSAAITNVWGTTNEVVERTGSLNLHQALAEADGTLSLVLSPVDPGVHNWLDPSDLHEGMLTLRWAEFPSGAPDGRVAAGSRVVSLEKLADALPPGTPRLAPGERERQCAERAAGYRRRLRSG